MKKKEIVTLALTAALLMTAHAVPVAAAESAAPNATSPTMPAQAITLRWESTNMVVPAISISGKQISVSAVIAPKKQTTKSKGTLYLERKAETVGHPLLLGRLMELEPSVLPKPTPAQRALPTVPE